MTMSRLEVITSVQRRRRWSRAQKERLVAATLEPGVTVSEVSQAAGIHSSQLFRWRKELCRGPEPAVPQLVPVKIAPAEGVSEKAAKRQAARRSFPVPLVLNHGGHRAGATAS